MSIDSQVVHRFVDHEVSFSQFINEFAGGQHGFDTVHPLF